MLVVMETVATYVTPEVDLDRTLRHSGMLVPYEPGWEADLLTDEFRVRYRINSFGYRDRLDRTAERVPGKKRVVVLGDSFGVGWGVEFEKTFANRLEDSLSVEFINASKNGGCPLWFVHQARHTREVFEPDLLLVQVFDNDPADNVHFKRTFHAQVGVPIGALPDRLQVDDSLLRRASRWWNQRALRRRFKRFKRYLETGVLTREWYVKPGAMPDAKILTRAETIEKYDVDPLDNWPAWNGESDFGFYAPSARERFAEPLRWQGDLLAQLFREAKAANLPVVLVYVPAYQPLMKKGTIEEHQAANPHWAILKAVCEEAGVPFVDGVEVFGSLERPDLCYYARDGHCNADGHARLAEAIEACLRERFPDLLAQSPAKG